MELVIGAIALISLGLSAFLGMRLFQLERQLGGLPARSEEALPEPPPRPLMGLRVALAIRQDHPHPVFATLLKELLLAEDVTDVALLSQPEAEELAQNWKEHANGPDILISGELVCNGYAEIYYTADLACSTRDQAICTLIEKPPHGDRPSNLAIDLIARLKLELEELVGRDDRRRAIRELRGPFN